MYLTCRQKLTGSLLSLPHTIKQKNLDPVQKIAPFAPVNSFVTSGTVFPSCYGVGVTDDDHNLINCHKNDRKQKNQ